MNPDHFISFTPAHFRGHIPTGHASHTPTDTLPRQQEGTEEDNGSGGPVGAITDVDAANFRTISRVLTVLNEGGMDVAGFLDALSWGNKLAVKDTTTKQARTNLMRSDRLATVVSRWLCPPRTSQGGPRADGARKVLLPLVIDTVKMVINREMDAVVEELKEDSSAVTEQSVLGTVIEEVQGKVQVKAPVFYDLVKTAAWSKNQDERNTLRDPAKVCVVCEFGMQLLIRTNP